jgi:hypothetical protein
MRLGKIKKIKKNKNYVNRSRKILKTNLITSNKNKIEFIREYLYALSIYPIVLTKIGSSVDIINMEFFSFRRYVLEKYFRARKKKIHTFLFHVFAVSEIEMKVTFCLD